MSKQRKNHTEERTPIPPEVTPTWVKVAAGVVGVTSACLFVNQMLRSRRPLKVQVPLQPTRSTVTFAEVGGHEELKRQIRTMRAYELTTALGLDEATATRLFPVFARFDDVVAEYPGFEACTPAHIEKVLAFGERIHARPDGHVLVHCHAGVSRSTAAAAILMAQNAPGYEEQAFLKLLELRKHG